MPVVVLIALEPGIAASLREVLASHVEQGGVVVREGATLAEAIARARAEHGALPLGVATRTSVETIRAIQLGADDALATDGRDVALANELVDRARVRGMVRAQRERAEAEMARSEKLSALGSIASSVAHQINDPLTAIVLTLDALPVQVDAALRVLETVTRAHEEGRGLDAEEAARLATMARAFGSKSAVHDHVDELRSAVRAIADIAKDIRAFGHVEERELAIVVSLRTLVEQALRFIGPELAATAIIERDYGSLDLDVLVPASQVTQALLRVLVSTLDALREAPHASHRVSITVRADDDAFAISIADTGPGMEPSSLARVFDPFHDDGTLKVGPGLGLCLSRSWMRQIGGDLMVDSVYGEGATFVVLVPRASERELRAGRKPERVSRRSRPIVRPSVLVLDSNHHVIRAYARVLSARFDLVVASDSQEAIDKLSSGSRADVVVAELGLSPFDGAHLHAWLAGHQPELAARTVFVAAELEQARHRRRVSGLPNVVLPRPTPAAALLRAIENATR